MKQTSSLDEQGEKGIAKSIMATFSVAVGKIPLFSGRQQQPGQGDSIGLDEGEPEGKPSEEDSQLSQSNASESEDL